VNEPRPCEEIQDLLAQGRDRPLAEAERTRIDEHLALCPRCREVEAWLGQTGELVAASGPEYDENALVAARVAARVQQRIGGGRRRAFLRTPPLWMAAAAVALMLGLFTQRTMEGDRPVRSPAPSRDRIEAVGPAAEEAAGQELDRSAARDIGREDAATGAPSPAPNDRAMKGPTSSESAPLRSAAPSRHEAWVQGELREQTPPTHPADSTAVRRALAMGPRALLALAGDPRPRALSPDLADSLARAWRDLLTDDLPDSSRNLLRAALRRIEADRE
jgi:hypothetical protein